MTITMARNHQGDSGPSSAGLTIALLAGVAEVAVMTGSLYYNAQSAPESLLPSVRSRTVLTFRSTVRYDFSQSPIDKRHTRPPQVLAAIHSGIWKYAVRPVVNLAGQRTLYAR